MFNKSTFGTTSTFGAGSTFGTSTPFGQTPTSTFGQRPATTSVFGASTFGAPQTTGTVFGAPQTSANPFGFGQQQAPATGMQQQQTTGFFGNTAQANTTTPLFGAPNASTSAFNMSRPTFGGFGTSTSLFGGQTQAAPLFGQPTTAPSTSTFFGSGFGGATTAATGTTIKFNPPTGTDTMVKNGTNQNIHTRHQCITSMKEYENKSLEELRLEDYAANRKGSTVMQPFSSATGTAQPGLFNQQPSTSGFSFGAASTAPKPLFGGATTQASTMTGFGAQTTTPMFGNAATSQSNPFNKTTTPFGATNTFSFGNPTATSTTGSLFGATNTLQPQQKSMFGSTAGSTGMFGNTSTTTTAPAFGSTGGMFGNTGGFGAAAATNPFGVRPTTFGAATSTAAPTAGFGFGATAPAQSTSLFGQPRPAGSTFGASTFGTTGTTFGGFQNPQGTAATGGLFGQQNKPTTFGATPFGATGTTGFGTGTTGFTGFGATTSTVPSLFSGPQANKPAFSFSNPTSFTGFGASTLGGTASTTNPLVPTMPQTMDQAALAAVQAQIQQHVMALNILPYGDSPLFRNSLKDIKIEDERLKPTNPAAQKSVLISTSTKPPDNKVLSLRPSIKIKPTPFSASSKLSLFAELEDQDDLSADRLLTPRTSFKKLNLMRPPVTVASSPLPTTSVTTSLPIGGAISQTKPRTPPLTFIQKVANVASGSGKDSPLSAHRLSCTLNDTIKDLHIRPAVVSSPLESPRESRMGLQPETDSSLDQSIAPAAAAAPPHPTGIVLTRYGYYTMPSMEELTAMKDDTGAIMVENFTVGREGYGNVVFPDKINVANLNLDEIVFFRRKEITLYPDDDQKPPVGTELNRKAQITLDCVWPLDKNTRLPISDPERLRAMNYTDKLEQATRKLGAKFVEYRPETGSWVFAVKHFSKYGLVDESDDEEAAAPLAAKLPPPPPINEATQTNGLAPPPAKELSTLPVYDPSFLGGPTDEMYPPSEDSLSFDIEMLAPSLLIKTSEKLDQLKFLFDEDQDLDVEPQLDVTRTLVASRPAQTLTPVVRPTVSPPRSPVFEPEPLGPLMPTKKLLLRPFSKSKLAQRTHLLQDASLFMARSFRVGHGPNLRLACTGLAPADDVYDSAYPFSYHLPRGNLLQNHGLICLKTPSFCAPFLEAPSSMKEMVTELLQHQLAHSVRSQDPDGTPHYMSAPGTASYPGYVELAEKYCSALSQHDQDLVFARQFSAAMRLMQALWGDMPGANSQLPYSHNLTRREALTQWLVDTTRHQLDDHFRDSAFEPKAGDVFSYLTCHQVTKAVAAAQRSQDHRLAMLVAAAHREDFKVALYKQLVAWREFKMDQYMEPSRLKVYALLAGKLVWTTSKGDINCCENLDWKRAFAVHLWYACSSNQDIKTAVKSYQEAFQPSDPTVEPYAVPPYPPYIEDNPKLRVEGNLEERHQDVCYHLLQMYSMGSQPDTLLCPTTAVASEIDMRLSWVLHQLLAGLALVPSQNSPMSDRLHVEWATQLELMGLWAWAVFPLLHISHSERRHSAVLDLLARNISLELEPGLRKFLCEDLGVPSSWLAHAQAVRARYEGRTELEARYLQEAGQLAESHRLVVSSLAAELIVNERHMDLRNLLEPLASAGSVPGWGSGGKLLLDWLDMVALLENLASKQEEELEHLCLERLEPQVVEVARKVCAYPHSRSPKDRLCQCLMAQKAFLLLQMVIRCQALTGSAVLAGTSLLRLLQEALLPEDHALQQLQSLVRTYMLQFAH